MRKKNEDNSNIFHKKKFDKNLNNAISKNINRILYTMFLFFDEDGESIFVT